MAIEVDKARTAVLVCHLQRDVIENEQTLGGIFGPEARSRKVVEQAGRLLDAARSSGMPRVLVRVAWRADRSNLLANLPLLRMSAGMGALIDGEPGAELVDELPRADGDIVLTHHRTSPFSGSDLHTILQNAGVDTLVLSGVATNVAIQTTAFAAADLGYRVLLVADACSAATPAAHDAALETLGLFTDITSMDDVLDALR
jgi:nicotinamidase-related amidase